MFYLCLSADAKILYICGNNLLFKHSKYLQTSTLWMFVVFLLILILCNVAKNFLYKDK